jgi:hypothetical protein
MPKLDPANEEYLAVVSEWSSYAQQSTSRVGNAYPIFCITRNCMVDNPSDDFPNPGYVFLVNRGELNAWDFVRLRPVQNVRYKHINPRECFFITRAAPAVMDVPAADCHCAVILDVTLFDPAASASLIRRPKQNATPVFFVRNAQQKIFGPLRRVQVNRSGDVAPDSIQWAAVGKDNIFYEFTADDLKRRGFQLVTYKHPEPDLNQVVKEPIELIIGPVLSATSEKAHDRLPPAELAEWYLRWRDQPEVPESILKTLRTAGDYLAETRSDIIRQRCRHLCTLMPTLEVLQAERRNIVRRYLDTDDGKQILEQHIAAEVENRAQSIEAEVLRRRAELAHEEKNLAARLEELQAGQRQREQALKNELQGLEGERAAAAEALAALEAQLRAGADQLAERVREQVPLLAALTGGRSGSGASVPLNNDRPTAMASNAEPSRWAQVIIPEPTRTLEAIGDESALITDVAAELTAEHLFFTRDFLANVYVTLKSSALNLIMGPPGHGKSSIIGAVARALGHGNALLEIAVRRSWSDDRYLLGFYDTFHGRYDPGPTGLATRLLQAQADWEKEHRGLYLILLDEFNLSAPEYYFSQLLQLLTRPQEQRLLRLFDPAALPATAGTPAHQIRLYPNVSFWGSINYDETTERLSPRLLDRTGMIFLTARDVLPSFAGTANLPRARKGVDGRHLLKTCVRGADQCPEQHWEQIEPLLDLLRRQTEPWGAGVELSPRVVDGVRRYLANSVGVLLPARAVDFVFQQRILPVLRGRGPRYATRIGALAEKLGEMGLERSARHVREALALAEVQFGDIDFLAY